MGKAAKVQEVADSIAATITQQFERRIAALEAHITDLEERLNERGVFSGDGVCTVPGNPAHLWEDSTRTRVAGLIEEGAENAREPVDRVR